MTPSPRRSWLVVAGIAATAAVAAGVLTVVTDSDGTPLGAPPSRSGVAVQSGGDAGDLVKTVKSYYAAIQAGDASKALSFGAPVSDKRLLTDAALRAQQAIGRIEKVTVDPDVVVLDNRALVDVVMTVGGKQYDDLIRVPRVDGRWQLPVAAQLTPELSAYQLLGVTIARSTRAYVFPGSLRSTLNNRYVTASNDTDVIPGPGPANAFSDREYVLNAAGTTAIRAAVRTAMATCARSPKLRPDDTDCPNSTTSITGIEVENSARWTAPTDYTSLTIDKSLDLGFDDVSVSGTVQFRVTYRAKAGQAVRTVRENVSANLYGSVDLTISPPTYSA